MRIYTPMPEVPRKVYTFPGKPHKCLTCDGIVHSRTGKWCEKCQPTESLKANAASVRSYRKRAAK